jgi:hypothetical protein
MVGRACITADRIRAAGRRAALVRGRDGLRGGEAAAQHHQGGEKITGAHGVLLRLCGWNGRRAAGFRPTARGDVSDALPRDVSDAPSRDVSDAPSRDVSDAPSRGVSDAPSRDVSDAPSRDDLGAPPPHARRRHDP